MKPRPQNSLCLAARSSRLLGLCTIAFCVLSSVHINAQTTWTGGTSTAWNTAGNWSNGIPVDGTVLNFGGSVYGAPANSPTDNNLSGLLTTGAINLNSNGTTGQNTGLTLGTLGQNVILGGDITTAISSSAPAGFGFTDTINLNLALNATRTINTSLNGARTHNVNVFGLITETGGTYGLNKSGGASLGLANTANSFAGEMTINGGTLVVTSLQASGTNSSIGRGSVINLAGGSLTLNTVGSTSAIAAISPIDRTINFSASGGINIQTVGNLTFSGPFNNTTATNKTFTLGGDAAGNTFQPVLADNGAGVLSVTKGGFGSWTLTGDNTFTGLLDIPQGTLNVDSISDTVGSDMGRSNLFKLGTGVQTGALNYTGNSATTTRQLQIGFTNGSNFTGGAIINANGANGGTGLKFTNADFNTTRPDATTTRTLTLGGSNTDANEISGRIIDLNTNLKIAVAKSGVGLWILSGDNTYTGTNTITGGTLQVNDSTNGLGNSTAANAIEINSGGTLSLRNNGVSNNATIVYGSTSNVAGYNILFSGGNTTATINVDNLTTNTGNTIQLGALTQNTAFARSLNITGGNGYSLSLTSLGLSPATGQTTTLNPTTSNLIITGAVTNPMSGFGSGNFNTLALDGTSAANRINGVISDAAGAGIGRGGDTRITKSGASTWTLAGSNNYTGGTTISGGILQIANSNALGFGGFQTTGTNNTTVSSGFTLDLNGQAAVNEPLTLSGAGIGANGALINNSGTVATIGNGIAGIQLTTTSTGSGYSLVPAVTIAGAGTGATAAATLGVTAASFGAPTASGTITSATVEITGGGGTGARATISNSGVITMVNPGTGYTSAPTITATVVGGGTITYGASNATNFTVSGIAMTNAGSGYTGAPTYTFSGGSPVVAATPGSVTLSSVTLAADTSIGGTGDISIAAAVGESGGARALTKVGVGTLTLSAASNTYSGTTIISGGSLQLGNGGTTGALTSTTSITNNANLTINRSDAATQAAALNNKVIGGTGSFTQAGAGTTTLSLANTYTGGTNVSAGTLVLNGNQSAANGAVSVTGKLIGSGTVGGATTINSAGIHNAGDPAVGSGVGSQTFASTLNYANGSIFEWDLNSNSTATGFDTVAASGVTVGTTDTIFKVILGATAAAGIADTGNVFWNTPFASQTWTMVSIFGSAFTSGAFQSVQTSSDVSARGSFTITGSSLTWTAVPEPSSALVGLLVGAGLLRRRRA